MAAQVLGRAVDHQVGPVLDRPLQIGRREGIVHRQQGAPAVGQLGDGGDVEDLQQRVGRRLDPDQLGGRAEDRGETLGAGVFGVAGDESPGLEDALQQAEGAAVEIGGGGHLVAGPQASRARPWSRPGPRRRPAPARPLRAPPGRSPARSGSGCRSASTRSPCAGRALPG